MGKEQIWDFINLKSELFKDVARKIWDHPELSLEEDYASHLHAGVLNEAGFRVNLGLKDLPTALTAEYGSGRPVIGIMGEYDALSGLSQIAEPQKQAVVESGAGHGCGHNLLGTAGLGAAMALKEAIDRGDVPGTIRYYGCPAEEEMIGKLYMLRNGEFDDLDAVLYWHPSSNNAPLRSRNLAAMSVVFSFKGVLAHAPQAHLGRSALDAVELMDVGANYLREHLPKDVLLHYSILGNGVAPNTVPDTCKVWYMMRASRRSILDDAFERLKDVAEGAALMTGTRLEAVDVIGSGNEIVPNQTIADLFVENMRACGGAHFTGEDFAFSRRITEQFAPGALEMGAKAFQIPDEDVHSVLQQSVLDQAGGLGESMPFSGDFDVSWKVPFGMFNCATWPIGVFTHTWQAAACAGADVGMHGMLFASKTLAGTAYDIMTMPDTLKRIREEFGESTKDLEYRFLISPDSKPHRVI